jgi:hypothetical protein
MLSATPEALAARPVCWMPLDTCANVVAPAETASEMFGIEGVL